MAFKKYLNMCSIVIYYEMEIMGLFGLTTNENKVLQVLAEKGETTTSDITNLTGISRPNCYDLLNKLIEKGLITCLKTGTICII